MIEQGTLEFVIAYIFVIIMLFTPCALLVYNIIKLDNKPKNDTFFGGLYTEIDKDEPN